MENLGLMAHSFVVLLLACSLVLSAYASPLRYGSRFDIIERRGCGTHIDLETRADMEGALIQARSEMALEEDLFIREEKKETKERNMAPVSFDVYWHIIYANETKEGGYVSDDRIKQQMEILNADYKSTNISWVLKNITRIGDENAFTNIYPGSEAEKAIKAEYHKGDSTVLNIFTAQFNSTTKSLGFASLPSTYLRDPLSDGLIIRHSTLPGGDQPNYNHGRTTVHEAGHWLGLYHTFEGGCEGVGDNIEDTAPEASESVGCPVGRKSCPGSKLEDPIHNFMDYSWDTCMTHFTPGQAKRMHEVIWAYRTKRPAGPSTAPSSTSASATSTSANFPPSNAASGEATTTSSASDSLGKEHRTQTDEQEGETIRGWDDELEGTYGRGWDDEDELLQERLWDNEGSDAVF